MTAELSVQDTLIPSSLKAKLTFTVILIALGLATVSSSPSEFSTIQDLFQLVISLSIVGVLLYGIGRNIQVKTEVKQDILTISFSIFKTLKSRSIPLKDIESIQVLPVEKSYRKPRIGKSLTGSKEFYVLNGRSIQIKLTSGDVIEVSIHRTDVDTVNNYSL